MDSDHRPSVLVVDDEPGVRETVAALLEDEGYNVSHASDGVEALTAIEDRAFDLVLSDVRMPRLDGPGLASQLRRRGHRLPIILMSAVYADVDLAGLPFIPKPFDFSRLLDCVAEALAASRKAGRGRAGSPYQGPRSLMSGI